MSDHWNSLANLLGTPSLAPQTKKQETSKPRSMESPPVDAPSPEPEGPKLKSKEGSRLRSSWDAVTSFFGIQQPEPTTAPEPPAIEEHKPHNAPPPKAPEAKRPRRSMWDEADALEKPIAKPNETGEIVPFRESVDEAPVAFGEPRRPKKQPSQRRNPLPPEPESVHEETASSEIRSAPRHENSRRPPRDREDLASTENPERRGRRHPPRRGTEPIEKEVESREIGDRESNESGEDTRSRRPRRQEENAGRERAERPPRQDRDQRGRSRRESGARDREDSPRDREKTEERTSARRIDREIGDTKPGVRGERPSKSAGFGAGLDDSGFDELDTSRDMDESSSFGSTSDREEMLDSDSTRKRRRKRTRGDSKTSGSSRNSARDEENERTRDEDREAVESIVRHSKIPSWSDAIAGLVATNLENHQRVASRGRGRGR